MASGMLRYSKLLFQSCIDAIKTQRFRFAWVILDSKKGIWFWVSFFGKQFGHLKYKIVFLSGPFGWVLGEFLDLILSFPFALDVGPVGQAEEKRRLEVSCGWKGGPTENWT